MGKWNTAAASTSATFYANATSNWQQAIQSLAAGLPRSLISFSATPKSVGAKVGYSMFLHFAWNNDSCFPGQDRLAGHMGMSVSRVNEYIKELEAAGLIEITRRGQGNTNLYKVNFVVKGKGKRGGRNLISIYEIWNSTCRKPEFDWPNCSIYILR